MSIAFPVLNAAKPLSSVKSRGSELHRLIIHCVKIVSPFISSKCIAFHSNCMSSVLVLLGSLYERMIYFRLSSVILYLFFPSFVFIFFLYYPASVSLCLPIHKALLASSSFATLSVPTVSFWRQSYHSQTKKMGITPVCPRLQSHRIK